MTSSCVSVESPSISIAFASLSSSVLPGLVGIEVHRGGPNSRSSRKDFTGSESLTRRERAASEFSSVVFGSFKVRSIVVSRPPGSVSASGGTFLHEQIVHQIHTDAHGIHSA